MKEGLSDGAHLPFLLLLPSLSPRLCKADDREVQTIRLGTGFAVY